jgi:hypothetical protein
MVMLLKPRKAFVVATLEFSQAWQQDYAGVSELKLNVGPSPQHPSPLAASHSRAKLAAWAAHTPNSGPK